MTSRFTRFMTAFNALANRPILRQDAVFYGGSMVTTILLVKTIFIPTSYVQKANIELNRQKIAVQNETMNRNNATINSNEETIKKQFDALVALELSKPDV